MCVQGGGHRVPTQTESPGEGAGGRPKGELDIWVALTLEGLFRGTQIRTSTLPAGGGLRKAASLRGQEQHWGGWGEQDSDVYL